MSKGTFLWAMQGNDYLSVRFGMHSRSTHQLGP